MRPDSNKVDDTPVTRPAARPRPEPQQPARLPNPVSSQLMVHEEPRVDAVAEPIRPRRSPAAVIATLRLKSLIGTIVLLLVAAVLTAAGFFFRGEAGMVLDGGAAANKALSDTGSTTDVITQVTKDMETVASYKYTDLDGARQAGQAVITGKFVAQYNSLFTQVKAQAPAQKAVVTGQVAKIGVRLLEGDNAILLVFMTQTTTRADTNQSNSVGLVYTVTAQRIGGKWLISDLTPR